MTEQKFQVYGYRWVVLTAFMFIVAMTQLLWITFAPITGMVARFYSTSDLVVGLLSMSFMIVYVVMVIPAAWAVDTYGLRRAVGLGALLTAVFALTRGLCATSLPLVFASQIGLAVAQPFVLGSITKVAARWFPPGERATASGLGTLAIYLGILVAMILTPGLATRFGIRGMLSIYGVVSALSAVAFFVFVREHPPTPACPPGQEARALMFDGLKAMVRQKDFLLLMVIFFIGLGIFNGISTWIENIVRPRGFTASQAGMLGGIMLIGGIVGALIIPILSDKLRRRRPFITLSLAGMIPGLLGMTFATSYWLLLVSGFAFGFFLLSSGPIGFQYGAEMTLPAPEATSNNLLIVMGQVSGIVFIFGMDLFKAPGSGDMTASLLVLAGLTLVSVVLSVLLKEATI